jgi:hypothetical protein
LPLFGGNRTLGESSPAVGATKGGDVYKALVLVQKVSRAQMEVRHHNGLYYSCDAKWRRGHVCEGTIFFFLIEEIEEVVEDVVSC